MSDESKRLRDMDATNSVTNPEDNLDEPIMNESDFNANVDRKSHVQHKRTSSTDRKKRRNRQQGNQNRRDTNARSQLRVERDMDAYSQASSYEETSNMYQDNSIEDFAENYPLTNNDQHKSVQQPLNNKPRGTRKPRGMQYKKNSSATLQEPEQHSSGYEIDKKEDKFDVWATLLVLLSYFFLITTFPFSLCACVKIAQEYERSVIFRIGRILPGGTKGPGIFFILPCIDTYIKVDLRTVTFDVPPQEILTRDSVTVSVDAVVYFRIFNATISVINVEDAAKSTKLLAASTLRNILGTKSLHEILSDRESVAISIQGTLDDATGPWGVKVERVEVKDVRLPVQLQRAMATEAEAAREARAKVIAAEGEHNASSALHKAALVINESPIAIQLRYLQTLTQIASEKNSTIVFPVPLEMLSFLANKSDAAVRKVPKKSTTDDGVEKF